MAATGRVAHVAKQVKPILSLDKEEGRRRVLNLYKAWYRQIPHIIYEFEIPISAKQGRQKLRELILKNKNVTDIRTIDILVIKGQMELVETLKMWKQKGHVMNYFKETVNEKPTDFLSKFFVGH
ncbi:NADH dehydrogenase (ubiquinone) B14 subunit [Tachypleus tridentatus]|uniref:NADH dehydrogenase (ubiquinone) B14 subunit n=1 Tax=Tachypleus tridentatus TaxID=6853 RepID=UPI003FD0CF18